MINTVLTVLFLAAALILGFYFVKRMNKLDDSGSGNSGGTGGQGPDDNTPSP